MGEKPLHGLNAYIFIVHVLTYVATTVCNIKESCLDTSGE